MMKHNFQLRLLSLSKYNFQLILLLVFLGFGCQNKHEQTAKIRGKIINPRTDEVVISRDFLLLQSDTLKLNSQNELSGTIKAPVEGLYITFIFPEYQTLYLKPGDSLAIHLNVDEFDESISFSGSLAFENNLLMEMFLANERENNYFYKHRFEFDLKNFIQKLDSFEIEKKQLIDNYKDEYQRTSSKFRQILSLLKSSQYYNLKENYAIMHPDSLLPADYFAYHSIWHQNLSDPNIIYLNSFADSFLELQLKKHVQKIKNPYLYLSDLINAEIYDSSFKNNLLVKYCVRYIVDYQIIKKDSIINAYYQKIENDDYKTYCDNLIANNALMQVGNKFTDDKYLLPDKRRIMSDSLFRPGIKTLVSFWDLRFRKNFISNLNKIKKYKEQYPELQFVIINMNTGQFDEWFSQIPKDKSIFFVQAVNKMQIQKIRPYSLAQIYLLNGQIIKGSKLNMYEPDFEQTLQVFYTGD